MDLQGSFGGFRPAARLVRLSVGRFYGTITGEPYLGGTIFETTGGGKLTVLYDFCREKNCADGGLPSAPLALGSDSKLYGTTAIGGASEDCPDGCGTIFQASPGKLITLYNFCQQSDASTETIPLAA
jgi:uncharacterized repeat protein (TIGR03803 family)